MKCGEVIRIQNSTAPFVWRFRSMEAKGERTRIARREKAKGHALHGHIDAQRETGRSDLTRMAHTV